MELTKNKFFAPGITAVITMVLTGLASYFIMTFNKGQDAAQAEAIRAVLQEEMQVEIDGETKTYGQVLSSLHTKVTVIETTVDILIEE